MLRRRLDLLQSQPDGLIAPLMLLDSPCLNTDIDELDVTITDNKSRSNLRGNEHVESEVKW